MKKDNSSHHPFDRFFKSVLSMRRAVEELLRYCLPPELLQTLDLRSLKPQKESYLDERLRESFADVVYICDHVPGQSSFFCC